MRKPNQREAGIPERLQHLADLAGSVLALAELSGVSRRGLNDWLNSVRPAHPTLLNKICEATGASQEWLRDGVGPPPKRLIPTGPANSVALTPYWEPQVRSILQVDKSWLTLRLGLNQEKTVLWNMPDESMEPHIGLGDPVLCREWPKENPPPITGLTRYCLVRLKPEEYVLRAVVRKEDCGPVMLLPRNPRFPEMPLPDGAEIVAEAVWAGHSLEQPMKERRNKERSPW